MKDVGKRLADLESASQLMGRKLEEILNRATKLDLVLEAVVDAVGRERVAQLVEERIEKVAEAQEARTLAHLRTQVETGKLQLVPSAGVGDHVFVRQTGTAGRRCLVATVVPSSPWVGADVGYSQISNGVTNVVLGVYRGQL